MTVERMVELLEIKKECVLRNATGECNRYCAGCDLLQDDSELHEMYTEAIALLKAQEPVVMSGAELTDAELIEEIRKAPFVLKPNVDAVPVEWLKHRLIMAQKNGSEVPEQAIRYVLWLWEQQHDGERRNNDGKDA